MSKTVLLKIEGMDCSSCVMNIDGALEDIDGIVESRTNFAKELTTVKFDSKKVSAQKVLHIVQQVGYQAAIID